MKFRGKSILVILLVLAIFATTAACGGGGASPSAGASASASASASTTPDKVYELNVNMTFIEENGPGASAAIKNCEERSGGRLKFTTYWGNTLLNIMEIPKGISDGIADISLLPLNMYEDQLPLNSLLSQPFMGFKDSEHALRVVYQMLDEFPQLSQEFLDLGMTPTGWYPLPPYQLHLVSGTKQVRVPEDLRGEKIITSKVELSTFLATVNCAAINQPITELYSSLEKGVANGVVQMGAVLSGFNLLPLLNQHVFIGPTGTHLDFCVMVIRTATLESMPEDLQQILIEEWTTSAIGQQEQERKQAEINYAEQTAAGKPIVTITDEELLQWSEPLQPINEASVAAMAQRLPVATEIAARIRELIASS